MKISIIGSAGRANDYNLWDKDLYEKALATTLDIIRDQKHSPCHLISGGAAWSDHIAVSLFLRKQVDTLTLHFPAPFNKDKKEYIGSFWKDPGSISNYYHRRFSTKMGFTQEASMIGIAKALTLGAKSIVHSGFFERNLLVGQSDILIAFTFGTHSSTNSKNNLGWKDSQKAGLKDGGTAHTWTNSIAPLKIHINLHNLKS